MEKNTSEQFYNNPRITTKLSRYYYDKVCEISDNIDFSHPKVRRRNMKSRSLGSTLAIILEIALQNEEVMEQLKKYMIKNGRYYIEIAHTDPYRF